MPNNTFLETYPLYKKFRCEKIVKYLNYLPKPRITMMCPECGAEQTFVMTNEYYDGTQQNAETLGQIVRLIYVCVRCQKFKRAFMVQFDGDDKGSFLLKVGQYPAWDISGDKDVEKFLGKYKSYYKKALICESQGYGIGAFGYYRRIVEEVIDDLLGDITELLSGDELGQYQVALEETQKTIVAADKIELVKDLLPPILRPDGMNPLGILHSNLSEGLHAESDEICLEYAEATRDILVFLVRQVAESKRAARSVTDSMRKLLDKKKQRSA